LQAHTIRWPNGVDFAPEFIKDLPNAEHKLQQVLEEGERSAKQNGWTMSADVRKKYEV
jgi:hypothetical protein